MLLAQLTTYSTGRSLAGQISHWASLGREAEQLLDADRNGANHRNARVPISELLASVDTPEGRQRVAEYIRSKPLPHFEPAPDAPGVFMCVNVDGTRTIGRFVDGEFRPLE